MEMTSQRQEAIAYFRKRSVEEHHGSFKGAWRDDEAFRLSSAQCMEKHARYQEIEAVLMQAYLTGEQPPISPEVKAFLEKEALLYAEQNKGCLKTVYPEAGRVTRLARIDLGLLQENPVPETLSLTELPEVFHAVVNLPNITAVQGPRLER